MTKATALLGAAVLFATATAVAAQPAPPPGGPRGGPEAGAPPPPPPGGPRRGPDGPPPPPPKGAHVRIERGDAKVDVRCTADEPTRSCADITLQLLDRLAATKPADAR